MKRIAVKAALAFLLFGPIAKSQEPWDYLQATNTPDFSVSVPVELGFINLANGNLHLEIPLASPNQRGVLRYNAKFVYDSRNWIPVNVNGQFVWNPIEGLEDPSFSDPSAHGTWSVMTDYHDLTGQIRPTPSIGPRVWGALGQISCNGTSNRVFKNFEYTLGDTTLFFDITISQNACTGFPLAADGYSTDGSGYHLFVGANPSTGLWDTALVAPDGTDLWMMHDANGNFFTWTAPNTGPLIDTLGRAPVTVSANPQGNSFPINYDVVNAQGSTSRYIATVSTINVGTQFHQTGVLDASGTTQVVTSIALPDGTSYQMQYDSYGELSSLTLPTGGTITFGYTNFTDAFGNVNRWATSKTSAGATWNYVPSVVTACAHGASSGCSQSVKVTQPSGDYSVYNFTINGAPWLTQIQYFSGANALLYSASQAYDFSHFCGTCFGNLGFVHATSRNDSVPSVGGATLQKQTTFAYDSPQTGNIIAVKEWNFYTGSPGPTPDRETDTSYQTISVPLIENNVEIPAGTTAPISKPSNTTVLSAGSQISQTLYSYDSTTNFESTSATGVTNHDDTNYSGQNTTRGLVTGIQRWISGSSFLNYSYGYDITGQIGEAILPAGGQITSQYEIVYFYGDSFSSGGSLCGSKTNAYVTFTSSFFGQESMEYDCGTGNLTSYQDLNTQSTNFYYNDVFNRPTLRTSPDGGWLLNVYTSPTQVDAYQGITDTSQSPSCTACRHDQLILDSLGRPSSSTLASDPEGTTSSVYGYDLNGRLFSVSNPYRSTSDPTYGFTTKAFDALNRITQVTDPDGNKVMVAFGANVTNVSQSCSVLGYPTLVTDEAGKQKASWVDGFGRVVEVDEPNSSGALSVATCYQYDGVGNLLSITQRGGSTNSSQWRVRTFTYDGLSRLVTASVPESGTTQYFYTNSTGGLCAGNINVDAICRETDARGITVTYGYDSGDRLTSETFSDGTPAISYVYDQGSFNGLTIRNSLGRRVGMTDASGQTAWSYDSMGRINTVRKTVSGFTKAISFNYNLDGSIASVIYPSGRTVTYTYSNAARPLSAVDSADGINYARNATYWPGGQLHTVLLGNDSGNAGTTITNNFNNRLEPTNIQVVSPTQTLMNLSYAWLSNGLLQQETNNLDGTRTQSFTYDQLSRLQTAQSPASWGDSYTVDPWANLLQKTVTQGTAENLSIIVNAQNQIGGFSYDARGDVTSTGSHSYTYDGAGRQLTAGTGTYTYDGDDLRVQKVDSQTGSNDRIYWRAASTDVLTESDTSGNLQKDFIFFNGSRIAFHSYTSGNRHYFYTDHMGSTRVIANLSGSTIEWAADYFPWGLIQKQPTSSISNFYQWAGQEYDPEIQHYRFPFRPYRPQTATFMSPDPYNGSMDVTSPQSMGRYAYVTDSPTVLTDPSGLDGGGTDIPGPIGLLFVLFGGGGHGPAFHPNGPPFGRSGAGQNTGPLEGETLGLPNTINFPRQGLAGIILPTGGLGCDFGPCVPIEDLAGQGVIDPSNILRLVPEICGGGGFGYGGIGGHAGPVHGEILGLVEYDSRLGGAHGGIIGAGFGHFTGGVESMRTWRDWKAHTGPIGLGGVEIPGATGAFGKQINTQSRDIGGLAQYEKGNVSVGFYAGTTLGSGRAYGGGAYLTFSWTGCHP